MVARNLASPLHASTGLANSLIATLVGEWLLLLVDCMQQCIMCHHHCLQCFLVSNSPCAAIAMLRRPHISSPRF